MAQLCGDGRSLAFEGSPLALFRSIGVNRYRRLHLRVAHPAVQMRPQPSALDADDNRWSHRTRRVACGSYPL
jgi:hypothetical protein